MELWFRPRDVACKPVYGDRQMCNSLLLRVRRRKKPYISSSQNTTALCSEASENKQFEYNVDILGLVEVSYTFQSEFWHLYYHIVCDGKAISISHAKRLNNNVKKEKRLKQRYPVR